MTRRDFILFDDPFDSPIVSPTSHPTSPLFNTVHGATLAERILNDPEAWKVLDENNEEQVNDMLPLSELEVAEELTWLEGEITRLGIRFTPNTPDCTGSALPEEDAIIPPSPTRSRIVKATSEQQEPATAQQDKFWASPKPGSTTVFSTYVRSPPGGLDAPRQGFTGQFPGLDGDNMTYLLTSESYDSFSTNLHIRLSHILGETSHATDATVGGLLKPSAVFSPPSSESSSSSSSSPRRNQSVEHSYSSTPSSPVLLVPSPVTTIAISPFHVHSGTAILSLPEWHGIQTSSPLGSAGTRPTSSSTPYIHSLSQASLAKTVNSNVPRNEPREHTLDISELINRVTTKAPSGNGDEVVLPLDSVTGENDITSELLGGSPSLCKRNLPPEYLKRCGMICETPSKRRPSAPLLHSCDSPKPLLVISLPDTKDDELPPPPVPPKDYITSFRAEKIETRRLPAVPTTSAAANCDFDINGGSSPMVSTLPPQPAHSSIHISHPPIKSNAPCSATRPLVMLPRYTDGLDSSPVILSATCPSIARSPRCPVGPRQRDCCNSPTSTKSARYVTTHINSGMSSMNMVNSSTNSPCSGATDSISALAALAVPKHVYSKSG